MSEKFLSKLKLGNQLEKKISLHKVEEVLDSEKHYKIYLEASANLTPIEISSLLSSIQDFEDVKIKLNNVIILGTEPIEKGYEIYDYVRMLLEKVSNVEHSSYFVGINNNELNIYTSNKETHDKIDPALNGVRLFLSNFGLWLDKINVSFQKEMFDFSNFKTRTKDILNKSKLENISNPEVIKGYKLVSPNEINNEIESAYFEGEVYSTTIKAIKNNTLIIEFEIANNWQAITAILFRKKQDDIPNIKKGDYVRVYGKVSYSSYKKEYQLNYSNHQMLNKDLIFEKVEDNAPIKRSEFSLHTKMSVMDGVSTPKEYINKAVDLGIKSIAFTDSNNVQSFPAIHAAAKNKDIKIMYGAEIDIVNDSRINIVENPRNEDLKTAEYVFFDLETTGISPFVHEIIEFGATKVKDGNIISKKQFFVKSKAPISEFTTKLTGITQEDVDGGIDLIFALSEIKEYFKDSILVAHNAEFDLSFLNSKFMQNGTSIIENPVIDTMKLSWLVNPTLRSHRLSSLSKVEYIVYDETVAHRADYDAEILRQVYENMLFKVFDKGIRNLEELNNHKNELLNYAFTTKANVYAKTQKDLKKLYKLISTANIEHFNSRKKSSQLPLSYLIENKGDLIISSPGTNSITFQATTLNLPNKDEIFKMLDFIEIHPLEIYKAEIEKGFYSKDNIKEILISIYNTAKKLNKPVIASSYAFYSQEEDEFIREVLIQQKGLGGKLHPLFYYGNKNYDKPKQFFRTTDEMISEMSEIFSPEVAEEISVTNPNNLANDFEFVTPIKEGLFTPKIAGSEEEFEELVKKNMKKLYGENPDTLILERFNKEYESIKKHGYIIIYYLSSLAVRKSLEDGYLVGSRGSVGSSLVATLSEITEVNPLPPHWLCKCTHHEFTNQEDCGYDLRDKICPKCGEIMKGEGHNIPFETFLGFEGDKVPDIDLNFSGEYQSVIHDYIKDILGEKYVLRAGTISTIASRTAYGYLLNYYEIKEEQPPSSTTLNYLSSKVEGTKRTTGQHPGGLIVVPSDLEIEDFTPINYPGNDFTSPWKTTHFDFHSIHDNLLKLDFLGHIDPSAIKMLEKLTGVNPRLDIPMNDEKVLSLFKSADALKMQANTKETSTGILGIPEFGTSFVRELVKDAKPETFADLVRISGLSHGTDVWLGNAKELIDKNIAKLKDVISVRDDIMTYLIGYGIDKVTSFNIMESVRKGKGLKPDWEKTMLKNSVPDWYIESCKKIKYMFPKAHATAYVIMAYRIAWFKINKPLAYYATFFSKRDTDFDIDAMYKGVKGITNYQTMIRAKTKWDTTDNEKSIVNTFDVVLEMLNRGYKIEPLDLKVAHATDWQINKENNSLIPPLVILDGLGDAVADKIINEREKKPFSSQADFSNRAGANNTILSKMKELGALNFPGDTKEVEYTIFDDF